MIKKLQLVFFVILALGIGQYLFFHSDTAFTSVSKLSPYVFLALIVIFIANYFIVSARNVFLYKLFGYTLNYKESLKVTLSAQLANLFFIPLVGSMFGQRHKLKEKNASNALISFVVICDRFFLACTGALISLCACLYVFNIPASELFSSMQGISETLLIFCSLHTIFYFFIATTEEKSSVKQIFSPQNILISTNLLFISFFSWILVGSAFIIAFSILGENVPFSMGLSAGVISSFIASLPITINGWGVREVASASIFNSLSVEPNTTMLVSISIGISSTLSILVLYFSKMLINKKRENISRISNGMKSNDSFQVKPFTKKIIAWSAYCAAFLILFNVRFSYHNFTLNMNIGDLFAYVGLFIAFFDIFFGRKNYHFLVPHIKTFLLLSTAAFTLAFAAGYLRFGFTAWALSHYLGWFVLLGYFCLGAVASHYLSYKFTFLIRDLLIALITMLLIIKLLTYSAQYFGIWNFNLTSNLEGYLFNRNAFAFQLLVALTLLISKFNLQDGKKTHNLKLNGLDIVFSALSAGLLLTGSRTGIITLLCLVVVQTFLGSIKLKKIPLYCLLILIIYSVFYRLYDPSMLFSISLNSNPVYLLKYLHLSQDSSVHERIYTYIEGIKIGIEYPLFGSGLGYFIQNEIAKFSRPLIIHNTPIWIFCEFGIMGLMVFGCFLFSWLKMLAKNITRHIKKTEKLSSEKVLLIGLIVVFGVMCQAHEMLYQRIFWFVFGLFSISQLKKKYFFVSK